MSHFNYAASTYFLTSQNPMKMIKSESYKILEKLATTCIKTTFQLPSRGSTKPILDLFKEYDPSHIIIKNYLDNI